MFDCVGHQERMKTEVTVEDLEREWDVKKFMKVGKSNILGKYEYFWNN